jgi:superfamily II DNA or RNA helicase
VIELHYDRGRISLKGGSLELDGGISSTFPAYRYPELLRQVKAQELDYKDHSTELGAVPPLSSDINLRDYQSSALEAWYAEKNRGLIELPTGAGKTFVAIKAMEKLQVPTLVVVPTLVLLEQWRGEIEGIFDITCGALGGGESDIRSITISTYDSASLRSRKLGNRFLLIVFDEVHHLPAPSYQGIGLNYLAPYRMGLTATLPRDEKSLDLLGELVGPLVYSERVEDLAGVHLSDYEIKTIEVPLALDERAEYDKQYQIYRSYLKRKGIRFKGTRDYLRFIRRSGRDPEARRALLARNKAMDIALNSRSKVNYLKSLLKKNPSDKTLVFTRHNKLVYRISKELLIPAITHQTVKEEREEILRLFRDGTYRRIVTSQVLDEGVDIPDASMGLILSGTGSNRQFIQRLGRILRKKKGKQATLYELVAAGTAETRMSRRRKR